MNALYVIYKYFEIKAGNIPDTPVTVIFGAKAAKAYTIAKDIIHLILCLGELIANDPDVSPYLKVVMVENYNVTMAEKLIPACDISEQISLASKEASGTGNMKFMLNGALTLGTFDGANVEIAQLVGKDNIYTFGASSDEVIAHYKNADYCAKDLYEKDEMIKKCVDFIVSDELKQYGDEENLARLHHEIISKDWFMTLLQGIYKGKRTGACRLQRQSRMGQKNADKHRDGRLLLLRPHHPPVQHRHLETVSRARSKQAAKNTNPFRPRQGEITHNLSVRPRQGKKHPHFTSNSVCKVRVFFAYTACGKYGLFFCLPQRVESERIFLPPTASLRNFPYSVPYSD